MNGAISWNALQQTTSPTWSLAYGQQAPSQQATPGPQQASAAWPATAFWQVTELVPAGQVAQVPVLAS